MNTEIRRLVLEQVAVFYQKSPSDSRRGWGSKRYPRVDFNVDMRHDAERRAAGTMTFNIWCSTECAAQGFDGMDADRAIENRLIELISGTFYTGSDRAALCAEWECSDEFNIENTQQNGTIPEIYGLTVIFELMEFPEQITASPDPVQGLNEWTKRYFAEMAVITHDEMPSIWQPTDEKPAIYWRFEGTASTNRQSYAVRWFTGTFAAHILAESIAERNKWTKAIIERAQLDGEIILPDCSPMFINRISVRHNADALREGQLELMGIYGVLTQPIKETAQPKLMHANMTGGGRKIDRKSSSI